MRWYLVVNNAPTFPAFPKSVFTLNGLGLVTGVAVCGVLMILCIIRFIKLLEGKLAVIGSDHGHVRKTYMKYGLVN